jgi:hypothetical protein
LIVFADVDQHQPHLHPRCLPPGILNLKDRIVIPERRFALLVGIELIAVDARALEDDHREDLSGICGF